MPNAVAQPEMGRAGDLSQEIVVRLMACFTVFAMRVAVSQFFLFEAIAVEHKPPRVTRPSKLERFARMFRTHHISTSSPGA